jgi:hypothetical protein
MTAPHLKKWGGTLIPCIPSLPPLPTPSPFLPTPPTRPVLFHRSFPTYLFPSFPLFLTCEEGLEFYPEKNFGNYRWPLASLTALLTGNCYALTKQVSSSVTIVNSVIKSTAYYCSISKNIYVLPVLSIFLVYIPSSPISMQLI